MANSSELIQETQQHQYLEIYKLHAQLAERISQRREGSNRLYVTIVIGLVALASAIVRFGSGTTPESIAMVLVGYCGIGMTASWAATLAAYLQLTHSKEMILFELEEKLPFDFLVREQQHRSTHPSGFRLSRVESFVPAIFGALFLGMCVYGLVLMCDCVVLVA